MSGLFFDRPVPTSHGNDGTIGAPPPLAGHHQGRARLAGLAVTLALSAFSFAATAKADITLNIDPVIESQPGRSWAAVGEMVMRYYSAPDTGPMVTPH